MKTALTIAGSDSCGGAGIQADLKTFAALGVYGLSAITAITAQNTCGVIAIRELDNEIITGQIDALFTDIPVNAVKIGMLSCARITVTVTQTLKKHGAKNIVVDPVMISKSGSPLLQPDAIDALRANLFPLADIVTPNLFEAAELVGFAVNNISDMQKAAVAIKHMGPRYVIIKGGHLPGEACDILYDGNNFSYFKAERLTSSHTHGTGCTFSSAVAAGLALGKSTQEAVKAAKEYICMAIQHGFALGRGVGPTNHFYDLYKKAGIYAGDETDGKDIDS